MKKFLMLLVAVTVTGVSLPSPAAAQDTAAGAAATQGADPKEATDAWTAWSKETNPATKFQMGLDLITKYPGSKVAENVAGTAFNDAALSQAQKAQLGRAYYDAYTNGQKTGQYVEYALGTVASAETDPAKIIEVGNQYMTAYPQGSFVQYIQPRIPGARAQIFQTALKAGNTPEAVRIANEAWQKNENEYYYTISLAGAALGDISAKGEGSTYIAQAPGWADRGIAYLEANKTPETLKGQELAEFQKNRPVVLGSLYRLKGWSTFLATSKKGAAATAAEYQSIADLFTKATTANDKDAISYWLLGSAHYSQYQLAANKYGAMTPEMQTGDEGKAALAEVDKLADLVIADYVKVLSFAAGDEKNYGAIGKRIEPVVVELYKYRHPDTPDGWRQLVKPMSTTATAAVK